MNIWIIVSIIISIAFISGLLVGYLPNRVIRAKE